MKKIVFESEEDECSSSLSFLNAHPDYDVSLLPSWVQENIENVKVYGHKNKGLILEDGRKYHLGNKLNDLTGKEWTSFINSVFLTRYPTNGKESFAHHIRKIHPTPKPPQLMRDIILFFTKENEMVFDCFMGVGGTLLGAALSNRLAAGIDLNQRYLDAYLDASTEMNLKNFPTICGNCLDILENEHSMNSLIGENKISLLLIDPPYSNMMSKVKTGADIAIYGSNSTPYTGMDCDLGNMERQEFLNALRNSVEKSLRYMKYNGYIVIFIKDHQPNNKNTNLLHAEVVEAINQIPNIYYKGMKIWADESTKPYPYGYPYSFVANQVHQYILIFRKEK